MDPRLLLERPEEVGEDWAFDWSALPAPHRRRLLGSLRARTFATSGSTGPPTQWSRTGSQLHAEAQITAHLLRSAASFDSVISVTPLGPLYGHVLTVLVPAVLGLPVRHGWADSADLPGRPLIVMVAPAWQALAARIRRSLRSQPVAAVHAGAALPAVASELALQAPHPLQVIELFGATETGLIASRVDRRSAWTAVDDVQLAGSVGPNEQALVVESPRVARTGGDGPGRHTLSDRVVLESARTFRFCGRLGRARKILGVKVDLDALEHQLHRSPLWADAACIPIDDPQRGEHYEIVVEPFPDKSLTPEDIGRELRLKGARPAPLRTRIVDRIDRSPMGKTRAPRP